MSDQSSWKLDPEAVRKRASSIPGCKEVQEGQQQQRPQKAQIISFLLGLDGRDVERLARVTVFCDTGTVAVGRVLCGEIRQTFRRHISTLDGVERLLRQPPKLPVIDHQLLGLNDGGEDNENKPPSYRSEMELADVGLAILTGEKEKLTQLLTDLESSSKDIQHQDSFSTTQAMEFQFSLPAVSMKHVDQCLNDITKMGKLVTCVATNGRSTIFLYGNGGVAYTPNIPKNLHHKLSQLRNSRMSSRPSYVALGTRDRYFVAFHDGSFSCKGPKGLDKELKKLHASPRSVAFGNTWDTFFVVHHDGSWKFQGRSIPDALEEKLAARKDRPDLECVHLGPNGEWFLKARNGRMWWGGLTEEADRAVLDLIDDGHELHVIDFGEDGSYFVSYD